jgi:hypothetical protein
MVEVFREIAAHHLIKSPVAPQNLSTHTMNKSQMRLKSPKEYLYSRRSGKLCSGIRRMRSVNAMSVKCEIYLVCLFKIRITATTICQCLVFLTLSDISQREIKLTVTYTYDYHTRHTHTYFISVNYDDYLSSHICIFYLSLNLIRSVTYHTVITIVNSYLLPC